MIDLVCIGVTSDNLLAGESTKNIKITSAGADNAKIFIWSGFDGIKPLCESKEIKLTEEEI